MCIYIYIYILHYIDYMSYTYIIYIIVPPPCLCAGASAAPRLPPPGCS